MRVSTCPVKNRSFTHIFGFCGYKPYKKLVNIHCFLQNKCEVNERKEAERKLYEDKRHAEEVAYFSRSNKQLKAQLEAFLAPAKK